MGEDRGRRYFILKRSKEDKDLLKGTWKMTKAEASGKVLENEISDKQTWNFADDKIIVRYADGMKIKWDFKLDPTQKPKEIDLWLADLPSMGAKFLGVYELDGDTLKVSYTRVQGERATTFDIQGEPDR
jgi:uncharacterized protein (TIGR03067 family)